MKKFYLLILCSLFLAGAIQAQSGSVDFISWKIIDEVLIIEGTGDIPEFFTELPDFIEYKFDFTSVEIHEGITGIGKSAFRSCPKLSSITIPASVENIGSYFIVFCPSMTSIVVDENNKVYSSVDGVLFNREKTTIVYFPEGRQGDYIIPASVETIGEWAFYCSNLNSVTLSDNTKTINNWAIAYCQNLKNITIPASVEIIGENVFANDGLISVTILGNTLKKIGYCAFYYCLNLTSINIPNSVTHIADAFIGCSALTSINIPTSLEIIDWNTFTGCSSLTEVVCPIRTPITIPDNLFFSVDFDVCILRVPAASVDAYSNAPVWSEFRNIVALEVETPKITLELDKHEIYLLAGATTMLTIAVTAHQDDFNFVIWDNSTPEVATVDYICSTAVTIPDPETGLNSQLYQECYGTVTAVRPGSTVISVSLPGIEDTCTVTVIQPGKSTIEGSVDNSGAGTVRVNLYIKVGEKGEAGEMKKGILESYVLLATTVPNGNGEYSFENLPEGSYKIDVEIDEYESEATPAINLSGNETRSNINFEVDGATGTVVPKIVTSAVETWHAASLQIYPNPFTDAVHVTVQTGRAPSLRMQVINTAGTIVHTQTIASPDETIHLGHLPAGLYIIRIENGKIVKTVKTIKIQ